VKTLAMAANKQVAENETLAHSQLAHGWYVKRKPACCHTTAAAAA